MSNSFFVSLAINTTIYFSTCFWFSLKFSCERRDAGNSTATRKKVELDLSVARINRMFRCAHQRDNFANYVAIHVCARLCVNMSTATAWWLALLIAHEPRTHCRKTRTKRYDVTNGRRFGTRSTIRRIFSKCSTGRYTKTITRARLRRLKFANLYTILRVLKWIFLSIQIYKDLLKYARYRKVFGKTLGSSYINAISWIKWRGVNLLLIITKKIRGCARLQSDIGNATRRHSTLRGSIGCGRYISLASGKCSLRQARSTTLLCRTATLCTLAINFFIIGLFIF